MIGTCNYINDLGNRCNKTYHLHNLIFRDPNYPSKVELTDLCKWHYDIIIGELTERVKEFQMKLSNQIAESARLRRIARENDIYQDNTARQQKIEDLKALIKKIQNDECKNYFCKNNLRQLEQSQKLFSLSTFKPSGRRHYTFYTCSLKCHNILRAKCGLSVPILKGQMLLS